jgi:type III secretion protein D
MDRAAPQLESLHALELRVLEGPQRGARATLPGGAACVLAIEPDGRGNGADIVLRDAAAKPVRVRVTADLPNAMLEVVQGQVQLGDRTLADGEQVLWAAQAPLRIGSTSVAFGLACVDDWSRGAASHATAAPAAGAAALAGATATPLRRRAEVWLAAMGAGVLLACAGALWIAHAAARPQPEPVVDTATLATALRASEFGALTAARGADGGLLLRGRLATQAQRQRLEAWLAARRQSASIDVVIDEAVVHDVTEVFRVNGVAVKAQAAGPGRIVVEAAEQDRDRLARAEEVVRRDVRGVESLNVRNTVSPRPTPAPPVPDDPGKRIASLVPGETAYLVTADGARYFIGAMLPSGHRITQIAKASVTLDRDGQQSTLNF